MNDNIIQTKRRWILAIFKSESCILAIISVFCFLAVFFFFSMNTRATVPSANCRIFIEQTHDYGEYKAQIVEITVQKDIEMICNIFTARHTLYSQGPICPVNSLKITFLDVDGSVIEFYPATDMCENINT